MYSIPYHHKDLSRYSFLITGGAGFIGSNLVEYLLKYGAGKVRVLDNFSTGYMGNLSEFIKNKSFEIIEGDIRNFETCKRALIGINYVSHQAALGSVPRSINDPITTNDVNVSGFLNMLSAVKECDNIKNFVYAASSSTYGDSEQLPKKEDIIGKPLSPYAVTKYVNELYADVFARTYNISTIGLRYFNVFGPKQSPKGAYAAVIPLFINSLLDEESPYINGDGNQTRDFTFIENVIQANIKALLCTNTMALNQIYNIAAGGKTSIKETFYQLAAIENNKTSPIFRENRQGDVRDSLADIRKAERLLDYKPAISFKEGLLITYKWHQLNKK